MSPDLPLHGVSSTTLPPGDPDAVAAVEAAVAADDVDGLRAAAGAHPAHLDAWARLGETLFAAGDDVVAYACARVGYHRGLDAIRRAGWGGQGPVPWSHQPNRGFLRSVRLLARAAASIGEHDEAHRCESFLRELTGTDGLEHDG